MVLTLVLSSDELPTGASYKFDLNIKDYELGKTDLSTPGPEGQSQSSDESNVSPSPNTKNSGSDNSSKKSSNNKNSTKSVSGNVSKKISLSKPVIKKIKLKYKGIFVKWKKLSKASGYFVYRKQAKKGKFVLVKKINNGATCFYLDKKDLKKKKTYIYKLKAYNKSGKSIVKSKFSKTKKIKYTKK
jgi:hypothetical protein